MYLCTCLSAYLFTCLPNCSSLWHLWFIGCLSLACLLLVSRYRQKPSITETLTSMVANFFRFCLSLSQRVHYYRHIDKQACGFFLCLLTPCTDWSRPWIAVPSTPARKPYGLIHGKSRLTRHPTQPPLLPCKVASREFNPADRTNHRFVTPLRSVIPRSPASPTSLAHLAGRDPRRGEGASTPLAQG